MNYIYDLHRTMMSQNLILVFQGDFTQETTKSILTMAERNLDSSGEESNIKRKVFNVMVESLQNIVKHSDELVDGEKLASMLVKLELGLRPRQTFEVDATFFDEYKK